MKISLKLKQSQNVATYSSIFCFIHCLITPLIIIFLPSLGRFFDNHIIELALFLVAAVCGLFVLIQGYCVHKKYLSLLLFGIGMILWFLHPLFEHIFHFHADFVFIIIGAMFVWGSYILNHRSVRCCDKGCNLQ